MAKYEKKSQEMVKQTIDKVKEGKLETGTGKKVNSKNQAIAIGLSEAREKGAKVPPPPKKPAGQRKSVKNKNS